MHISIHSAPVSLRGAAGSASVKRRVMRSPWQLTFCVAWSGFPFTLPGKLGRLGNLPVQSYQHPFAKLFILLERLNLLEKLAMPFPNQIRLQGQKPCNLLEKLKLPKLLKLERLIMPFLNQIKKRLRMLKLRLLEFELLGKTQRLPVKLFLLTKPKLLLLTLTLLTLPNPKKIPPRHDGGGVARRHD
jgi:hypothetical protein